MTNKVLFSRHSTSSLDRENLGHVIKSISPDSFVSLMGLGVVVFSVVFVDGRLDEIVLEVVVDGRVDVTTSGSSGNLIES